MALAIFDLDNTLIAGDSDYLWGVFLVEKGLVDGEVYERENSRFYQEYKEGRLDIYEFIRFALKPLRDNDPAQLRQLREEFLQQKIDPIIQQAARDLVERHRVTGDTLLIITATNAFVTQPIAARFGIENLLATQPELVDGRYTGNILGEPTFQQGKVNRLRDWLAGRNMHQNFDDIWFYSDSHNDLPLLRLVGHPVAVDQDDILTGEAKKRGWPMISLRE